MSRRTAPQLVSRSLAPLTLAVLALGSGCYETTPHQAQIVSHATPHNCGDAVSDVFLRSGFIQLPTPRNLTMFFAARMGGPYNSFLTTGSGVGVTLRQENGENGDGGMCRVTIEALSPDPSCSDMHGPFSCGGGAMNTITGEVVVASNGNSSGSPPCPIVRPLLCDLTSAPSTDNNAAVDELARRVQVALGPSGRVN